MTNSWQTVVFFFFSFHLALITELFITENRKILSRRGAHLDRLILCPLVQLYIMTAKKKEKKKDTLGITVRTAEQIYIKLYNINTEQHNNLSVHI